METQQIIQAEARNLLPAYRSHDGRSFAGDHPRREQCRDRNAGRELKRANED